MFCIHYSKDLGEEGTIAPLSHPGSAGPEHQFKPRPAGKNCQQGFMSYAMSSEPYLDRGTILSARAKGQLISKWFLGVIDFPQKTNEQIRLYYYDTSG